MNKIRMVLPVLLVVLFIVHPFVGQSADNTNTLENPTTPEKTAAMANETILQGPAAMSANAAASTAPNLSYIWSVTGLETGQVIMVLHQEEEDLFGQAKYEPDSGQPWNAIVVGSVAGEDVDLVVTALKGDEQTSSRLKGTFDTASQSLKGNFFQVSEDKISARGSFEAMWINPDTSSYAPATIEQSKPGAQQTASTTETATIPNSVEIISSSFQPDYMTVQMGTTVTWINHDTVDQVVTATNEEFDSGNIVPGGQYQYTFSQQGTFDYFSKINPSMTGKIIVTGSSKSRFHDVHQDADRILTGVGDISQIPIGMGGSGLA